MIILPALTEGQRRRLQKAVGERVNQLTKIKEAQSVLYRAIHSAIKEHFCVESYHDIKQSDFLQVMQFIAQWK